MARLAWIMTAWLVSYPLTSAAQAPEPYRESVISVRINRDIKEQTILGSEQTPNCPVPWRIEMTRLHGGKQEGIEQISLHNGKMSIVILPTRGMSIYQVNSGDVRLGWNSPVKEHVNPDLMRLDSRGGIGWVEGFNEWMCRCGLEYAGHPGRDEFIDNTGAKSEMMLTLHGKIGNTPASEVEIVVDKAPPYRLRVRGTVNERAFFGPKLELTTEISTEPGSETLRIEDKVTNHGALPQEFELIYHTNYGTPLLEKGSQLVAPLAEVLPMNDSAAKGTEEYATYQAPTKGFVEQVYLMKPLADASGQTLVMLKNAAGDLGTSIRWSTKELPYFTQWKNTAAEADGYVTGLEPGTNYPYNRSVERKAGRLSKLDAGQSRQFRLDFGLHVGAKAVGDIGAEIAKIQGEKKVQITGQPPKGTE